MMVYPVKSGSELEPDFPNVACKQASKFSHFIFAMHMLYIIIIKCVMCVCVCFFQLLLSK